MKRTLIMIAVAAVAGCLTVSAGAAQAESQNNSNTSQNKSTNWNSNTGQAPGWGYGRMFNPRTVETIHGQVERVETTTHGRRQGVHLLVKTETGTIPVVLGPSWFIDNQETKIRPKDQVSVTGSKITVEGKPALIASEVRTDGQLLTLRNQYGRPVWAAWGSANQPGAWRGQGMGGGMMGEEMMGQGAGSSMRPPHRPMMARLREMQASLDKKVQQMNEATGQKKIDDMAGVITELVHQRNEMINHIEARRQEMWRHLQQHREHMKEGRGGWGHPGESPGEDQD